MTDVYTRCVLVVGFLLAHNIIMRVVVPDLGVCC